jgi:hypothetical protein
LKVVSKDVGLEPELKHETFTKESPHESVG